MNQGDSVKKKLKELGLTQHRSTYLNLECDKQENKKAERSCVRLFIKHAEPTTFSYCVLLE